MFIFKACKAVKKVAVIKWATVGSSVGPTVKRKKEKEGGGMAGNRTLEKKKKIIGHSGLLSLGGKYKYNASSASSASSSYT